nr:DUF2894 domain-containing protein [Ralstonia sp. UBA689]
MHSEESSTQAVLDRWRERGADRLDPVRFRFIAALHRRAAGQTGEARRILDERLGQLLAAYQDTLEQAAPVPDAVGGATPASAPVHSALAALLGDIAGRARADGGGHTANASPRRPGGYAAVELLDDFRQTWARVSAEHQLRQSLEQVPTNAGPLNSSNLVHRSLVLMRELSPDYLRQFLSYVDALSWLERMSGDGAASSHEAARTSGGRKSARSRSH